MGYREIFDDIKKGQYSNLYLFYGEEEYIKEQALAQMIDSIVDKGYKELNYQLLDGSEITMSTLENACETLPFMAEKRMVVVKDLPFMIGKRSNIIEDDLKNYLSRIPYTTYLVLYQRGSIDKRRAFFKTIKSLGKTISFEPLTEAELRRWTIRTLKSYKKEMSPEDLQYFFMMAGEKLEVLNNEILKLVSYVGNEVVITREAVDNVVTHTVENTVFQLVDAIGERKGSRAMTLLNRLLFEGQVILLILTMIARQFRLILQCKAYQEKGYSGKVISEKLKLPPFVIKGCLMQARNFSYKQLIKGLEECLNIDYGIKSGRIEEQLAVELLILKLCGDNVSAS